VISPLLANIYLHYVLDEWFEQEVKPRLHGRAFLIRYADDFIMGFACEEDARRVLAVLPKRFGKFGLELHPDKTRLVDFRRPASDRDRSDTSGRETWDVRFPGFHASVGPLASGSVGGAATHDAKPFYSWPTTGTGLASQASP